MKNIKRTLLLLLILFQASNLFAASGVVIYKGINIAGAEFNGSRENAKHYKDYIWPSNKNLEQMKDFGFNTIRVPFRWSRMQKMNFNPLNESEAKQLDRIVQTAHILGLYVVLDPHDYGVYNKKTLKPNQLDLKTFNDFWQRLANRYLNYPNVIFGLMNEPHKQTAGEWAMIAQAGVDGIRQAGADQLILVPGTRWSGMHSWLNGGDGSNANALLNIEDPLDNYAYEMHQYFDKDYSGMHKTCIASEKIIKKFIKTTAWLKENNKKAFLGEFGVAENANCVKALKASLGFMQANSEQWLGWTYWATGSWMARYPFNFLSNKSTGTMRLDVMSAAVNK